MICNVSLFPFKSAFCTNFMASLSLILLIMQLYSKPIIFKIAISRRFRLIINKSWHLLHNNIVINPYLMLVILTYIVDIKTV